jgi:hypothetical protein
MGVSTSSPRETTRRYCRSRGGFLRDHAANSRGIILRLKKIRCLFSVAGFFSKKKARGVPLFLTASCRWSKCGHWKLRCPIHHDLVFIESYLNVANAEFARARLAMEGIPACLHNVTLVLWHWDYSNLAGGVRLLVRRVDAQRARFILASRATPPQWQPPPWSCGKCRAEVDGMWKVCWACGTARDGTEDPEFFSTDDLRRFPTSPRTPGVFVLLDAFILMILIVSLGLLPAIAVAALAAVARSIFSRPMECDSVPDDSSEPLTDALIGTADVTPDPSTDESVAIIQRAWRAAVFGFFDCPPLTFYSFWSLFRSPARKTMMGRRDRFRYYAAWLFALTGLPGAILFVLGVVWGVSAVLWASVVTVCSSIVNFILP